MRKLSVVVTLAMLVFVSSCNQKGNNESNSTPTQVADTKKPDIKLSQLATNKDLYCEMPLADGSIADTASYEGKLYGFCSSECKAEFLKNAKALVAKQ